MLITAAFIQSGPGTYVLHGFIYSCLLGRVKLVRTEEEEGGDEAEKVFAHAEMG